MPKSAKTSLRDGVINPQNYNFMILTKEEIYNVIYVNVNDSTDVFSYLSGAIIS